MATQPLTLTTLPDDLLFSIFNQCDPKSHYALRQTCQRANIIGKESMTEEVASRILYHHPEQYRTIRNEAIKESKKVVINALTTLPELITDDCFPPHLRHDTESIKTAYVAALCLNNEGLAEIIQQRSCQEMSTFLEKIAVSYRKWKSTPRAEFRELLSSENKVDNELTRILPFVRQVIQTRADIPTSGALSPIILENIELVLEMVRTRPETFRYLDTHNQDNSEVALAACIRKGKLYEYASKKLKNDFSLAWKLICSSSSAKAFRFASPEIQKDFVLALIASLKKQDNLDAFHHNSLFSEIKYVLLQIIVQTYWTVRNSIEDTARFIEELKQITLQDVFSLIKEIWQDFSAFLLCEEV